MKSFIDFPSWLSPMIIPGLPFLRWYGLMYVLNIVIIYTVTLKQIRAKENFPITEDNYFNLVLWAVIGMVLGARLFSVLFYDTSGIYLSRPWLVLWPFDSRGQFTGLQGMSYHGGVVGIIAGTSLYMLVIQKQKFLFDLWDIIAAIAPLSYTFGRIGNFINGELYGRVSTIPWAMRFPHAERLQISDPKVAEFANKFGLEADSNGLVNLPRHPSQLYEALFEGVVLWAFLWFLIRNKKTFNGFVMSWYCIGYGAIRFFLEYFRQPDSDIGFIIRFSGKDNPTWLFATPWNFTMGQILCILMVMAGIGLFYFLRYKSLKAPSIQTYHHSPVTKSRKIQQKIKLSEKKKRKN